jgi:hypothetical protein
MYLTQPAPFLQAVKKLGSKSIIARSLSHEQWQDVPLAIRDRAFFSARIEDCRFLQAARDMIMDNLTGARQDVTLPSGEETTMLSTGDRATFVKQAQALATQYGLGDVIPPGTDREARGLIERTTDLQSVTRLRLIFDTQLYSAEGYGWWKQGNDQDILDAYPAQRFIRAFPVQTPRPLHAENEGKVRLKSDLAFWKAMNDRKIGGFGVPWGPFGFNSGMDVEDVTREEAEKLGLLKPSQQVQNPEIPFNQDLEASARGLDPDILAKLKDQLGSAVEIEGDSIKLTEI